MSDEIKQTNLGRLRHALEMSGKGICPVCEKADCQGFEPMAYTPDVDILQCSTDPGDIGAAFNKLAEEHGKLSEDYDTLQTQRDTYARMDAKVREALGLNDGSGRGTVETIQAMIAERDTLRAERDALQQRVRELEAVLVAVEWRGDNFCCPLCDGWEKHVKDCALRRLLSSAVE